MSKADWARRLHDAAILGGGLGLAVATAQVLQNILLDFAAQKHSSLIGPLETGCWTALVGFAIGAAIGFLVPSAFRAAIKAPADTAKARALRELVEKATRTLGTAVAADDWGFRPNNELGAITPAEAIQFQGYTNKVFELLENEALSRREGVVPTPRTEPSPVGTTVSPPLVPTQDDSALNLPRNVDAPAGRR